MSEAKEMPKRWVAVRMDQAIGDVLALERVTIADAREQADANAKASPGDTWLIVRLPASGDVYQYQPVESVERVR